MFEFVLTSVEAQNLGINYLTFSSAVIISLILFQCYGLYGQSKSIWTQKSGKSVSWNLVSYNCLFCFSFLFYGIEKNSLVIELNTALGFFWLPILAGLWRFKKISLKEIGMTFLFLLMIPLMIFVKEKEVCLLLFSFGGIFFMFLQVKETFLTKSRGALYPLFIGSFLVNSIFWFIYASSIHVLVMQAFNFIMTIQLLFLFFFYLKYSPE